MLTESKVIYLGYFKCMATRPGSGYVIATYYNYNKNWGGGGRVPPAPPYSAVPAHSVDGKLYRLRFC